MDLESAGVVARPSTRPPDDRRRHRGWYLDGELWCNTGGNTIARGPRKVLGEHIIQPFAEIDPAAWDVGARLALMDEQGIHAAIIYPNGVGFASNEIWKIADLDLRAAVLETYNDFFMEVQEQSGGRLFPQPMLPVWDMDFTVREMAKRLEQGATGFTLSDKPELLGLPELDDPWFAPVFDTANEARTVLNFHIGAGGFRMPPRLTEAQKQAELARPEAVRRSNLYWSSYGPQRRLAIMATQLYMSNARLMVNLCMGPLFDRYPNLRIASAESGIGWIPFVLEAMEYQLDEMVTAPEEVALQQRRPREYFRDHFYATFWFEECGPAKLIDDVGVHNVLVETDVPHPTCLYPGAQERFAAALGHHDRYTLQRILQDNAAELYGLPLG